MMLSIIGWLAAFIVVLHFTFKIIFELKSRKFYKIDPITNEKKRLGGPTPHMIVGNALPLLFREVHDLLLEYSYTYRLDDNHKKSSHENINKEEAAKSVERSRIEDDQSLASSGGEKMFLIWLGTTPFLVVHEKEAVKKIFLNSSKFSASSNENRSSFEKGMFANIMRPLVGDGLLTSEGAMWRLHHKLAVKAFQPASYKDSMPGIGRRVKEMLGRWEKISSEDPTRSIDLCSEFSRLTLDNIGVAAFGEDFNAINSNSTCIYDEVAVILKEMQGRAQQLYPIYKLYPSVLTRQFDEANEKIHNVVRDKIERRRKDLNNQDKESIENRKKFLLDVMIESQEQFNLTNKEIEDEMITWVMGGHETTASLLCWVFYLLDRHPLVTQKVVEELRSVLPMQTLGSVDRVHLPNMEELSKMEYLTMVLQETLRLYPPAPLLNRITVGDQDIYGYNIPDSTEILICPWVLHRDPEYWTFPDQFLPERFKDNDHSAGFHYLPFGAGPRGCLGKMFAFLEAKLVISMILQYFMINVNKEQNSETEVAITLRPKVGYLHATLSRHEQHPEN